MLFIIDSVPVFTTPEEWNRVLPEDIADRTVIRNPDSIRLLGWEEVDGLTYIFTKEYRRRPDSLRRIPGLMQMKNVDGRWTFHDKPYSGKYIDYYLNGRIQNEGHLVNGQLNGVLTVYYNSGRIKSVAHYKDGKAHGEKRDYFKNGALSWERTFVDGKQQRGVKHYFINGQVGNERRFSKRTPYDTAVSYYSTGQVAGMLLMRNGSLVDQKRRNDLHYHRSMLGFALRAGDLKAANQHFYKIWKLDSTSALTFYEEGDLLFREARYEEALAAFDKALVKEPLMREALVKRAYTRLKSYQARQVTGLSKEVVSTFWSVAEIAALPAGEQDKICTDVLLSEELSTTDIYNTSMVPRAIVEYCLKRRVVSGEWCVGLHALRYTVYAGRGLLTGSQPRKERLQKSQRLL